MSQKIGTCTFTTTDGSIGGQPVRYHVIRTERNAPYAGFMWDDGLVWDDVVLEPGSPLISQPETEKKLGRPAGVLPEKWLERSDGIAICPNNFWYAGSFVISSHGFVVPFGNFRVRGKQEAIVLVGNKWQARRYDFDRRVSDENVRVGFGMPLILQNGRVRSLNEYAGDPRVLGDLRNFVDFSCGVKGLPGNFWLLIRKVLPGSAIALRRMLAREKHVEVRDGSAMLSLEIDEFATIIERYGLGEHLRIERAGDEIHFTVRGPLPIQRIPVVGVGFDANYQLIAVVAEGRQKHSAGVSCEQLAQLMLDEGIMTGGLGSAGGDAGVWANINGEFKTLSSGPYRPVPCLLIMG